jgi:ribosomal protein L40E
MGFFERLLGGHYGKRHHRDSDFHDSDFRHGRRGAGVPVQSVANSICPSCRAANVSGARFCHQCGTSMVTTACPQCSAPLVASAKFCGECGRAQA